VCKFISDYTNDVLKIIISLRPGQLHHSGSQGIDCDICGNMDNFKGGKDWKKYVTSI
jgi:hypothetical protein